MPVGRREENTEESSWEERYLDQVSGVSVAAQVS